MAVQVIPDPYTAGVSVSEVVLAAGGELVSTELLRFHDRRAYSRACAPPPDEASALHIEVDPKASHLLLDADLVCLDGTEATIRISVATGEELRIRYAGLAGAP